MIHDQNKSRFVHHDLGRKRNSFVLETLPTGWGHGMCYLRVDVFRIKAIPNDGNNKKKTRFATKNKSRSLKFQTNYAYWGWVPKRFHKTTVG